MKKEYKEPPSVRIVNVNVEKGYAVSEGAEKPEKKSNTAGVLSNGTTYIWD